MELFPGIDPDEMKVPSGPRIKAKVDGVYHKPGKFDTKVVKDSSFSPMVVIPRSVIEDMSAIIKVCPLEVSWLTLVKRVKPDRFLIYEVILPRQRVSAATTVIDPNWIADEWVKNLKPEELDEKLDDLRGWFHSHILMPVDPSGQDDRQMNEFKKDGCSWFIRGIGNKVGDLKIDIFLFDSGVVFLDVPWTIQEEEDDNNPVVKKWISAVEEKCHEISAKTPFTIGGVERTELPSDILRPHRYKLFVKSPEEWLQLSASKER